MGCVAGQSKGLPCKCYKGCLSAYCTAGRSAADPRVAGANAAPLQRSPTTRCTPSCQGVGHGVCARGSFLTTLFYVRTCSAAHTPELSRSRAAPQAAQKIWGRGLRLCAAGANDPAGAVAYATRAAPRDVLTASLLGHPTVRWHVANLARVIGALGEAAAAEGEVR